MHGINRDAPVIFVIEYNRRFFFIIELINLAYLVYVFYLVYIYLLLAVDCLLRLTHKTRLVNY